jgi:hypothetical protein
LRWRGLLSRLHAQLRIHKGKVMSPLKK